jgi:hypothetical protein
METYYFENLNKFYQDYVLYQKIRQKLHSYRHIVSTFEKLVEYIFFTPREVGIMDKTLEFDMLNIFKRFVRFNSLESGPKLNRVLPNYEYE